MKILGISAFYHDSAACLLIEGEIIAAAQEERFTRKKHDSAFPANAISFCLEYAGMDISEMDAVVFYDKPFLKFERLLETYYNFIPRGISSFVTSMPVWVKEKIFLKSLIKKELNKLGKFDTTRQPLLFPEHHLSHAASAFFASPFNEALILTIDGVGEWATASISFGKGNNIRVLKELHFPHSLGLLYSAFTYYLGFRVNSGEYKLMGLAPYGIPGSDQVRDYEHIIHTHLIDLKDDGSLWLNRKYFSYATGLRMIPEKKWEKLFGFPRKNPDEKTRQHHCNLAYAIQKVTEEIVEKMVIHGFSLVNHELEEKNLCLAGGVALNCVSNGKLVMKKLVDNIFIQPAAGDAGGALGAAMAAFHIYFGADRKIIPDHDLMKGSLLGPEFTDKDIKKVIRKYQAAVHFQDNTDNLTEFIADQIIAGKVVGWFQGRMEFGPRALGNRSILGDARNPEMQKKLNLKIKYRESFRPFAPVVLLEDVSKYFVPGIESPYMLLISEVHPEHREKLPDDYYHLPLMKRLYTHRSDIPAITHLDFSARVQTVRKEVNLKLYDLLTAFKKKTGCPVMVNTSFNVRGEPIVCSPEEAFICFMRTEMDVLVLNDFVFLKEEQPEWKEKGWKEKLEMD
ncbi:MAG: carbamoyltransferase [Bacteroidales bacterium]|nr:carbamoyltransferase [Bacteroidales bacterium]